MKEKLNHEYEHEPDSPDKFYTYSGPDEFNGVKGRIKSKNWTHEGKSYRRVYSFVSHEKAEEERQQEKENEKHIRKMDTTFLETGLTRSEDSNPLNQGHQE